jgi:NAD(P)H-dependent flavin oxidoreductase YrpB (nitropropane dioxygenase family)
MTQPNSLPLIIQGGMGVAVSNWRLARAVSVTGNLGVVSGTMLDTVLVRRLQDGDPGGEIREAISHFPVLKVGDEILGRYFEPGGRNGAPYKVLPMYKQRVSVARQRVTMLANFVEVWLAKRGHGGAVGINLLTKVQAPTLPSLYGAMLAGVDYVLMGAGIPREIPGALDALARHEPARVRFDVEGPPGGEPLYLDFDPSDYWSAPPIRVKRPKFLAIVSAASLAATLARKSNGRVDGFIVEGPMAGGHNAPPRGPLHLDASGAPIYGERDIVDLEKMRELGLPFWIAGGAGSPAALARARESGAAGIQVGTLFAYCRESGIAPEIRRRVLRHVGAGDASIFTDPLASPTGYPFKVVRTPDDPDDSTRQRICDLGYLRVSARGPDGRLVYRCAAEPVEAYVAKGGDIADTVGRRCLCNGLAATVGYAQVRAAGDEPPLVTSGDELLHLPDALRANDAYSAEDVVEYLLGKVCAE